MSDDILDEAVDAALALAAERPWREVSLREIAERAGVDFAELYAKAPAKPLLVLRLSQKLDRAALATAATQSDDPHDRLFDATMARVEAMEPHRAALRSMARGDGPISMAPHLPLTARAILEAAGVTATPPRLAAMTLVWAPRRPGLARRRGRAQPHDGRDRQAPEADARARLGRIGAGF